MLFPRFKNNPHKSPEPDFIEKTAYGIGDFSSCIIYAATQTFLLYYYTEYVNVNIAVVTTIMLFSRFLDGFTDLAVGYLVDRTKSPYGKTRVWILRMLIPFFISSILVFSVPVSWGETSKLIYIAITYNLVLSLVYTAINLPYGALTALISKDPNVRGQVTIFRSVLATCGYTLTTVVTLPLVRFFGDDALAWSYAMVVLGGIATVLFFITFLFCQERVVAVEGEEESKKDEIKGIRSFSVLLTNKYWLTLTVTMLLIFGADIISGAAGIYYLKYYLKDPELIGNFTLIITIIRLALMMAVLPYMMKKIGKRDCLRIAILFVMVSFAIRYVAPYSLAANYISCIFMGLGQAFTYACMWAMIPDTIDYGEYNSGKRTEGVLYSSASFATKVANGLGTVIAGFVMNMGGYDNAAETQTPESMDAILNATLVVPAICYVIALGVLWFYTLDRKLPEIVETLSARREEDEKKHLLTDAASSSKSEPEATA